jgi:hypothetical protein
MWDFHTSSTGAWRRLGWLLLGQHQSTRRFEGASDPRQPGPSAVVRGRKASARCGWWSSGAAFVSLPGSDPPTPSESSAAVSKPLAGVTSAKAGTQRRRSANGAFDTQSFYRLPRRVGSTRWNVPLLGKGGRTSIRTWTMCGQADVQAWLETAGPGSLAPTRTSGRWGGRDRHHAARSRQRD